ncbi:MAG: hypothetical protein PHE59_04415 [Patescibacteria group bacterium]|nr:hypothetical protein [Patescibacteria group bacterium]MDD5164676.1 hypothetical protein [Patescibacteria group bacterium]MDD5535002.1 hypothetical protein [Patescibacteria group bacterium]
MKKLIWTEIISLIVVISIFAITLNLRSGDVMSAGGLTLAIPCILLCFTGTTAIPIILPAVVFSVFIFLTFFATSLDVLIILIIGVAFLARRFIIEVDYIVNELGIKKSALFISVIPEIILIWLGFWLVTVII